ncbi:UNVERIFIED_CONTAM: Retrovirus-related Pol polyprotein from transposon TNT 1-94 [Sesamum latifolium]|uniref:Retrovirus-related Pol polyprotein from transposon TNT 1-94 n=1 Tax=Sesamum latifolium TaxID=2727402 RepID=A0AAW2VV00_9LAMI
MDVKTAFLHGDLDEKIYMEQPCDFIDKRKSDYVCLLKKSHYGLKQSPRQWNKKFDHFMKTLMFHKSAYDPCLYFKIVNNAPIFLVLYVDDKLIASPNSSMIKNLQNDLCKTFEMKDLENVKKILGMTIDRDKNNSTIFLNQKTYVKSVLDKFSMNTTEAFKEAMWLEGLLKEIGFLNEKVTIFSDSQSGIQICKNPVFHDRTKHIDVRYHFIRDIVEEASLHLIKLILNQTQLIWELVSLTLQVPHRRPAMMIARDPYLGPGSFPQVLVQGGE